MLLEFEKSCIVFLCTAFRIEGWLLWIPERNLAKCGEVHGFVLRTDLLIAQAEGNTEHQLKHYRRDINATLDSMALSQSLDEFIRLKAHQMLVVDEYGEMKGIVTLEAIFETLLGLEIIDESDRVEDMQKLARKLWKHRVQELGIDLSSQDSAKNLTPGKQP